MREKKYNLTPKSGVLVGVVVVVVVEWVLSLQTMIDNKYDGRWLKTAP